MQSNRFRKGLLAALYVPALVTASLAAPSLGAEIVSNVAPPPVRVERVAPREGYVWAPGYWQWNGNAYYWVAGSYVFERRGSHWIADRWEQDGAHWHYLRGHWER